MRFFFNFRLGSQYFADSEGDELPDLAAAREEGRLSARELMCLDHGEPDPTYQGGVFEITDSQGAILALTQFQEALLDAVAAQ